MRGVDRESKPLFLDLARFRGISAAVPVVAGALAVIEYDVVEIAGLGQGRGTG